MLSLKMNSCKTKTVVDRPTIKLPNKNILEAYKTQPIVTSPSHKVAAMCNFDPVQIACSPPGGMFMQNLRIRMENVQ
jgi:hypothetical protein